MPLLLILRYYIIFFKRVERGWYKVLEKEEDLVWRPDITFRKLKDMRILPLYGNEEIYQLWFNINDSHMEHYQAVIVDIACRFDFSGKKWQSIYHNNTSFQSSIKIQSVFLLKIVESPNWTQPKGSKPKGTGQKELAKRDQPKETSQKGRKPKGTKTIKGPCQNLSTYFVCKIQDNGR